MNKLAITGLALFFTGASIHAPHTSPLEWLPYLIMTIGVGLMILWMVFGEVEQ